MENEIEEIKIKATKNFDSEIGLNPKLKKIMSLQIINKLIIIFFLLL